jgi:hypothetical protein
MREQAMMKKDDSNLPAKRDSNTARPTERDASPAKPPAAESNDELYAALHGPLAAADALCHINTQGNHIGAAAIYVGKLRQDLKPRDAIEEMLVEQLAVTHARVVKLSGQAVIQKSETWYRTLSETCDRAANTFRRLTLAFREYREPRRTTVMAIQQANLANQQVVQQISGPAEDNHEPATLPPVAARPAITSGNDSQESALDVLDRSTDNRGEEPVQHERVQTRTAKRVVRGRGKRSS